MVRRYSNLKSKYKSNQQQHRSMLCVIQLTESTMLNLWIVNAGASMQNRLLHIILCVLKRNSNLQEIDCKIDHLNIH